MANIIKKVGPASIEPHYTSLASWEAAAGEISDGSGDVWWAECYQGTNLGPVTIQSWLVNPTATKYPKIYAAPGNSHDGGTDSDNAATVVVLTTEQSPGIEVIGIARIHVEGIMITSLDTTVDDAVGVSIDGVTAESFLYCDGVYVDIRGQNVNAFVAKNGTAQGTLEAINCVAFNDATTRTGSKGFSSESGVTTKVYCYNCVAWGFDHNYWSNGSGSTFLAQNCYGGNAVTKDYELTGISSADVGYSASDDATATDFGGTGNVASTTPANEFTGATAGQFTPKSTGTLYQTGHEISATALGTVYTTDARKLRHDTDRHGADSEKWCMGVISGAPLIDTIGTGKDYTTLAAWETARETDMAAGLWNTWAECYGGSDLGQIGTLTLTGVGDAELHPKIYAASGHENNGDPDGGAYSTVTTDSTIESAHFTVQDMRFEVSEGVKNNWDTTDSAGNTFTVERCLFRGPETFANSTGTTRLLEMSNGAGDGNVWNCVGILGNSASATSGTADIFNLSAGAGDYQVINCTAYQVGGANTNNGIYIYTPNAASVVKVQNCVAVGASDGDYIVTSSGTIDMDYCFSGDATADDDGGTGHSISHTAANLFENLNWSSLSLQPKTGSDLINAGVNQGVLFANDITGYVRPGAWDVGAYEFITEVVVDDGLVVLVDGDGEVVTAGEDIKAGELVYTDSNDSRVYLADSDQDGKTTVVGVALNEAAAGQPVKIQSDGVVRLGAAGGTALTRGDVYVAHKTPGKMISTRDNVPGYTMSIVGIADSERDLNLSLFDSGVTVADAISGLSGIRAWWQPRRLALADGASLDGPWTVLAGDKPYAAELQSGTVPKYDRNTMQQHSIVTTGAEAGMETDNNDTRSLIPADNQTMMLLAVFRPTNATALSAFVCNGSGASSAGATGYRGYDLYLDGSAILKFRRRNTYNTLSSTQVCTSALVNDTDYAVLIVRETYTGKMLTWCSDGTFTRSHWAASDILRDSSNAATVNLFSVRTGGSSAWTIPGNLGDVAIGLRGTDDFGNVEMQEVADYINDLWGTNLPTITELSSDIIEAVHEDIRFRYAVESLSALADEREIESWPDLGPRGNTADSTVGPIYDTTGWDGSSASASVKTVNQFLDTRIVPAAAGTLWVVFSSGEDNDVYVGRQTAAPDARCYLGISATGKMAGGIGAHDSTTILGTTSVDDDAAHVGILTWDGTTVTLYSDESEEYSAAQSGSVPAGTFYIMGNNNDGTVTNDPLDTEVKEIGCLDRAIDGNEAKALYNQLRKKYELVTPLA